MYEKNVNWVWWNFFEFKFKYCLVFEFLPVDSKFLTLTFQRRLEKSHHHVHDRFLIQHFRRVIRQLAERRRQGLHSDRNRRSRRRHHSKRGGVHRLLLLLRGIEGVGHIQRAKVLDTVHRRGPLWHSVQHQVLLRTLGRSHHDQRRGQGEWALDELVKERGPRGRGDRRRRGWPFNRRWKRQRGVVVEWRNDDGVGRHAWPLKVLPYGTWKTEQAKDVYEGFWPKAIHWALFLDKNNFKLDFNEG